MFLRMNWNKDTSENTMQGDNYSITGDFIMTAGWFWQLEVCLEAIKYEKLFFQRKK